MSQEESNTQQDGAVSIAKCNIGLVVRRGGLGLGSAAIEHLSPAGLVAGAFGPPTARLTPSGVPFGSA